jgi:hypothetical protein
MGNRFLVVSFVRRPDGLGWPLPRGRGQQLTTRSSVGRVVAAHLFSFTHGLIPYLPSRACTTALGYCTSASGRLRGGCGGGASAKIS